MGQHILVVDDDSEISQALQELLESEGFTVDTAWDGASALSMLKRNCKPPDVILLDLMMPGMSGEEFCEALDANPAWAPIPVIITSGAEAPQLPPRKMGTPHVTLRKPFKVDQLLETVQRALE